MPASALFVLPANRSEVRIDVQPGNQTTHDVATFTAIAGGILACVGFVFLLSDVASGTTKLADPDMQAGLALSGAGVVGLGVSIPLLIANATTVRFP